MADKPELKPCPFCTSNQLQIASDGGCQYWKVWCTDCNCVMPAPNDNDKEEGAIKAWNRRVTIIIEE